MIYGVPYKGSKNRLAKDLIDVLPAGKRLVDLFGGGGAISHCAVLSDKWDSCSGAVPALTGDSGIKTSLLISEAMGLD